MNDELKPCPFCGNKALIDRVDEGADYRPWYWWTVHCSNRDCVCDALCHEYETEAEAITAWNTRADDAQVAANDNLPAETAISADGHARNDTEMTDSRERLEASMLAFVERWAFDDDDERRPTTHMLCSKELRDLLDRQKRITIREHQEGCIYKAKADELQTQVDELTAERDHFRKHVNHLMALIADIARKQPYTFDPEAPYETLDTIGDYLDELHGDVASLTAERDELRKERDRWHVEQVHAYGNWEDVHEYAKKLEAERDDYKKAYESTLEREVRLKYKRDKLKAENKRLRDSGACVGCEAIDGQIQALTTERDELRGYAAEKIAELADKQRVIDVQRESFRKMEKDCADMSMALDKACAEIGDTTGTCPWDKYNTRPRDCDKECKNQLAECWRLYFEGVRHGEEGSEG